MSSFGDSIGNTLGRFIPLVRKRPVADRKTALAIVPMRNPLVEWERREKTAILDVPMRDDRLARLVKRMVRNVPSKRHIELDEVGASVWELCDGKRDINSLVDFISKSYKLTRREAEASVTAFLQTLAKKNLIGLMRAGGVNSAKCKR